MATKTDDSFVKQGSMLALAGILTRFIGLLYRGPLTRIIGRNGIANYNGAYEIYNIALIVSVYSIPVAVSKLVSMKDSKGEYINSRRIFKYSMRISAVIGFVVSAFLLVFATLLANSFDLPNSEIPLRFLAPTIFIFSIMGIIRGYFQGKKTMLPTSISQIVEQIINAVMSIAAAILLMHLASGSEHLGSWGAAGGTFGTFAGAVAGLIFLVFYYRKYAPKYKALEKEDTTGKVDSVGTIIKLVIMTMFPIILSQTIYQLSGIIDTKLFHNIMADKGFDLNTRENLWASYSNSYKWLYNVPVAISSAFGVTIVPMLSGLYAKGDLDKVREKVASSVKINMLIAIPSCAGLAFLAKPIILLIFNDPTDIEGPKLMLYGCLAVVFFSLSTFTNGVLQGINHLRVPVIHSAVSLIIHIPLTIVMLKVFDLSVYGMVIGNVSYALVICVLNWIKIGRVLHYRQEVLKTFLLPAVAAVIMGFIAFFTHKFGMKLFASNTVWTFVAMLVAVGVYALLIIALRVVSEEDLMGMPKGRTIVRILKKVKLLK